jgi:hypothetical protein
MLRQARVSKSVVPAARFATNANLRDNLPTTISKHIPAPLPPRRKSRSQERSRLYEESILTEGRSIERFEEASERFQEHQKKEKKQERKEESKEQFRTKNQAFKLNIFSYAKSAEEWLSSKETAAKETIEQQQQRHPILIGLLLTAIVAIILEKTLEKTVFSDNRLNELEKKNQELHSKNSNLIELVHSYKHDLKELKVMSESAMKSAEQMLAEQARQIKELEHDAHHKGEKIHQLRSRLGDKQASLGRYSIYYKNEPKESEKEKTEDKTTSKKP